MANICALWRTSNALRVALFFGQTVMILLLLYDRFSSVQLSPSRLHLGKDPCQGRTCLSSTRAQDDSSRQQDFTSDLIAQAFLPRIPSKPSRLFYNRVPKCGSHTFLDIIQFAAKKNNFTFTRAPEYMRYYLEDYWQMKFVNRLRSIEPPMLYERHLHFLNFSKYGLPQPVYINIIRDPLQRLVSWYYFRRFQAGHIRNMPSEKRNRTYDECVRGNHSECIEMHGDDPEEGYYKIIPFFCGQHEYCRNDQKRALQTAKRRVEKDYLLIGVTEQFGDFVGALEYMLPSFFDGVNMFYQNSESNLREKHRTTRKVAPADDVARRMRELLVYEYSFYKFVRQKFNRVHYGLRRRKDAMHKNVHVNS